MNKSELQELQKSLLRQEALSHNIRQQNEKAMTHISSYIESISEEAIASMTRNGVEVSTILSVDLKALASDKNYREKYLQSMEIIKSQISSFIERGLSVGESKF